MEGFEEAAVLLPTSDGLGFAGEQKIEPKAAAAPLNPLDPSVDLATIRAEKRRREIEAMSKPAARDGSGGGDVFASDEFDMRPNAKLSLREQLQLNKERAEAAWKEKHNPFAPPPGLSDDDYAAYLALEESRVSKHAAQRAQEQEEFEQFAAAVRARERERAAASASTTAPASEAVVSVPSVELDPSLSFSHLESPSAAVAALDSTPSPLLAPLAAPLAAAAASSSSSGLMPPLVLKRKHSTSGTEKKKRRKSIDPASASAVSNIGDGVGGASSSQSIASSAGVSKDALKEGALLSGCQHASTAEQQSVVRAAATEDGNKKEGERKDGKEKEEPATTGGQPSGVSALAGLVAYDSDSD